MRLAGQIAVKVDIHSVGTANGHASSRGAGPKEMPKSSGPKSQAPPTKVIHANGTVSKAAPAKGKPGASKASQKRDPAEVQRERQLADEQNVRTNNPCALYSYTDAQHCTRFGMSLFPCLNAEDTQPTEASSRAGASGGLSDQRSAGTWAAGPGRRCIGQPILHT